MKFKPEKTPRVAALGVLIWAGYLALTIQPLAQEISDNLRHNRHYERYNETHGKSPPF